MLNIGLIEFLVIFFFLILFIRPEDIPKISKNLGLVYRKISRYFYNIKYELNEIEKDISLEKPKRIKKNEISKALKRIKK